MEFSIRCFGLEAIVTSRNQNKQKSCAVTNGWCSSLRAAVGQPACLSPWAPPSSLLPIITMGAILVVAMTQTPISFHCGHDLATMNI
jgi:hypothetical protein